MRRIEHFSQNIQHSKPIEEQMEEAQKSGIIKSFALTTLSAMNARRDADICLWCDEVWSADHSDKCLYVPDHNCMFTCGKDFEVFAFVKVSKEGFKPMPLKESHDEVITWSANNPFDEMCDPKSNMSTDVVPVTSAHHVFDRMFEPILSSNDDINALVVHKTTPVFETIAKHDETDTQFSVVNCLHDVVNCLHDVIESADKAFVEMPVPTFMLEMAQSAKTIEGESLEVDHELESHEVSENHVASLEHTRRMLAKLGSLDGPCFWDLVIIGASSERFCLLLGLLFDQCQSLDDVYEQCDKISYPRHPRFQKVLAEISEPKHKSASPLVLSLEPKNVTTFTPFQVTISTLLFVDVENEVLWWGENCMSSECVVWKTMSDSTYYHIIFDPGISLCSINNAEICPYTMFFELRNGCELEISYKEALSWGNLSQCCEFAMTSSSFRALNSDNDVGSEMILLLSKYWKVFAINLSSSFASVEIVNGTHAPNTPWVFMSFVPSYLESDTSSIFFTYTLEDKGDFKGVEDTSEKCTQELLNALVLWRNYIISWTKKVVGCLANVLEMGGVGRLPLLVTCSTWRLMRTETYEVGFAPSGRGTLSSLLNHSFDPGGKCIEARLLIYDALVSNFHHDSLECQIETVMALFNCGLVMCSECDANNVDIELALTRILDLCDLYWQRHMSELSEDDLHVSLVSSVLSLDFNVCKKVIDLLRWIFDSGGFSWQKDYWDGCVHISWLPFVLCIKELGINCLGDILLILLNANSWVKDVLTMHTMHSRGILEALQKLVSTYSISFYFFIALLAYWPYCYGGKRSKGKNHENCQIYAFDSAGILMIQVDIIRLGTTSSRRRQILLCGSSFILCSYMIHKDKSRLTYDPGGIPCRVVKVKDCTLFKLLKYDSDTIFVLVVLIVNWRRLNKLGLLVVPLKVRKGGKM